MYIALTVITLEQFPTETRASSTALCMSVGLLGGVGLAFVDGLSTSLLIGLVMLFATGAIGAFFIRETTGEPGLMNHYSDIER
jgi:Na+/proline symporter